VSQVRADELILWVRENDALERVDTLEQAAKFLGDLRSKLGRWVDREKLDRMIEQTVESAPEALIVWADETRRSLDRLLHSIHKLGDAGTPEAVLGHIVAWVYEAGTLSRERLERLEVFANSLERLPFSAASKARHWQAFLNTTNCGPSSGWTAARAWIAELESVTSEID
jgi:hypothetical protein